LRKDIGFKGVVITDDLNMGAICKNYKLEEVVIDAINAGNDILLFSNNYHRYTQNTPKAVKKIVKKAIKDKKISESQIDDSFNRIVTMKKNLEVNILKSDMKNN
jgi:beta-N-acetylhexosaminidase